MIQRLGTLLATQLSTIPLIILIFRLPLERKVASLGASFLFVCLAFCLITYRGPHFKVLRWGGWQFLGLAVLPILILRFQSWSGEFNTQVFLGFSGSQWHGFSNISFMVNLLLTLGFFVWNRVKSLQGRRH